MNTLSTICAVAGLLLLSASGASSQGADDLTSRAHDRGFDATGVIDCTQSGREATGRCTADIVRGADRDAVVVVTFSNGFSRILTFADGAFLRANTTMSGTGTDTDTRLDNGIHHVRVEGQLYALPDAMIFEN